MQHCSRVIHYDLSYKEFDYHSLRHTHATMLLEAGAYPIDIQERLGHANLDMTYRYTHDTDRLKESHPAS